MKQGWEIRKFEKCIEKVTYSKKIKRKEFLEQGEYPIVSQEQDLVNGYWDNKADLFILKKPVVIFGDHTKAIKFIDFNFVLGADGVKILQPIDQIETRFLYYFLKSISLGDLGYARHYRLLKETQMPIPPLPEQQRIVKILDKAFVAIDKAKQNAEQNLRNAKEVFQSKLQAIFDNGKLKVENGEWEETTLSSIAVYITDGDHMPPPKTETGIPFITISNIDKQKNSIDFSKTFMVSTDYFHKIHEKRKPQKNDVLYTVTGSYGIPVLIESDFEFCFQRHIGLIRPNKNTDSKWLFYWILSPQAIKQAHETATGTAQKTVSIKALRNFSIPKIPLEEQKQIVKQLDKLSSETKQLEANYQQKIDNLAELKKSILQKAFTGKL